MKVFALSDIHIDYAANRRWIEGLSEFDYRGDVLILAGDLSDSLALVNQCFAAIARRFLKVLYVPGNHDLWVLRDVPGLLSFGKLELVRAAAAEHGVSMAPFHCGPVSIVPLFSWYDDSFGTPGQALRERWMDYRACRWPGDIDAHGINARFLGMNHSALQVRNQTVISFSHFVPRLDLLAPTETTRLLQPVMGSVDLEAQIRRLMPAIHVYGHSHRNVDTTKDGIRYVNHAFGYPSEQRAGPPPLRSILEFDPQHVAAYAGAHSAATPRSALTQ
ncbi:MAG: metallophosphoesterase [Lysobacter sp.]